MSDSRRRVVAVAISTFAILAAGPGYAQLKPKVRVLTTATTSVPPECAEGTVAPPPRVEVPLPAPVSPAPARGGLSTALRVVQQAAERNDYDSFRRSLAAARSTAASATRGGERDAAQNVLAVDSDLEKVWDFAQTTRTGAFYSDENPAVMEIARRYGAPQPLRISGQTLYPTHELREIVTREASKRLANIGIHVTSGRTRSETRVAETRPRPAPPAKIVETQPMPRTHHRSTPRPVTRSASHVKKAVAKPVQIAAATPPPAQRKPAPAPAPVPAPMPVPAPQPVVPPPPAPVPQPVTATVPPPAPAPITATTAPPAPPVITQTASMDTATSGTDAVSTTTTANDTSVTTGTTPTPKPVSSGGNNLALRIFVVLIAIGLLVALFRASS